MAAASDKARFFLEQSVPELKEYERKGIFSADEITSIARKRSDFEHKINARGSTATVYARYAEFEINVEALRRKRVKRLGVKTTTHSGKRRIFFVFDRGTRKHPGDVDLWLQAIEFARKEKAYKKLQQIFASVLRLHPRKSDLWIYAAEFAMDENGDMTEARSYMQRGLRFCKSSKPMWLEYGRLEMSYIAKLQARREILGIAGSEARRATESAEEDENVLQLPKLTAMDVNPDVEGEEIDKAALQTLDSTPAMSGAIPIAIFDAAMAHLQDPAFALDFFGMVTEYDNLPACRRIAEHVESELMKDYAQDWHSQICHIRLPVVSVPADSPAFVPAFREVLKRLKTALEKIQDPGFVPSARSCLQGLLELPDLGPAIQTVGDAVLASLEIS
ncbi:U3 snoRNP protein [Elasticomyces elasticus]|uniref:U3 snoRNP protein n=1 Tax=Exophiala sideris TaxID=1016849 RepID=A0ABR0JCB1_9EURO|nr:U3 snoRNP protein [Elasticomyces elasticus]KAK5031242.1 U3 snoRNP protein [Exophiala sideris]KAK5038962.1 U3 snoRNP protein [Exophiala sideris]KAK5060847.1 U3 snoRNP protein [Exophiala sideris]KAK5183758.1 U3 snoRNP protein [Eurotiomycetes sp. CCFEE 6388]